MLERLGVNPSGKAGEPAEFENLWIAALISSIVQMLSLWLILSKLTRSSLL
jgi:hypothetical protein